MLKRPITYIDYDGNEVTKDFHFHLSEADLIELQYSQPGGFQSYIKAIVEADDNATLIKEFKKIIQMSFGVREGDHFIRSEENLRDFMCTPAYSALFTEFVTSDEAAATFITGVLGLNAPKKEEQTTLVPPSAPLSAPPSVD